MKSVFFLSATAVTLFLGSCNGPAKKAEPENNNKNETPKPSSQNFSFDTTTLSAGDRFYQCPMDLEVISDKPGLCPKCEMELVVMTKH